MSNRKPTGPPPPPVVQRLHIRYAKRGRLRFSSHRDFARAFERALRRAQVPMAYSAGFTPHPKISYVGAAPTGVASEAEYLEIALAERRVPRDLQRALDEALPAGLDVLDVEEAVGHLPERIDGSRWQLRLPGVTEAAARTALTAFLAQSSVPVERVTKDGRRSLDARAGVVAASARGCGPAAEDAPEVRVPRVGGGPCAIIDLVVRHLTPAVRPDDVLTGLRSVAGLDPPAPAEVTRLAQGLLDESGALSDPLAADRAAREVADRGAPVPP